MISRGLTNPFFCLNETQSRSSGSIKRAAEPPGEVKKGDSRYFGRNFRAKNPEVVTDVCSDLVYVDDDNDTPIWKIVGEWFFSFPIIEGNRSSGKDVQPWTETTANKVTDIWNNFPNEMNKRGFNCGDKQGVGNVIIRLWRVLSVYWYFVKYIHPSPISLLWILSREKNTRPMGNSFQAKQGYVEVSLWTYTVSPKIYIFWTTSIYGQILVSEINDSIMKQNNGKWVSCILDLISGQEYVKMD